DISLQGGMRICLALGEAQSSSNPTQEGNKPVDRAEIDRYRFLAANIPHTNLFLLDKDLNYLMAEGPDFKYWGLERSHFEGVHLTEVHTTNLEEIRPVVLKALKDRQTVSKELSYMQR